MLEQANSNSDQLIASMFVYDTYAVKAYARFVHVNRKWITTKYEIFVTSEMPMTIIWKKGDIKATKSEESRPNVGRPFNRYPFLDQGYPRISYWYYGYP